MEEGFAYVDRLLAAQERDGTHGTVFPWDSRLVAVNQNDARVPLPQEIALQGGST